MHLATALAHADAAVGSEEELSACDRLPLARLRPLSLARQYNLVRAWVRARGHLAPPEARLRQGLADMLAAAPDTAPRVDWHGAQLRRYRDCLFLMAPLAPAPTASSPFCASSPLRLPTGLGQLEWSDAVVPTDAESGRGGHPVAGRQPGRGIWLRPDALRDGRARELCFRVGGEWICLPGRGAVRTPLKQLFQEWGVLPWMRARLPLLRVDGEIAAIGDLAVGAEFVAKCGEPAVYLRWGDAPAVF